MGSAPGWRPAGPPRRPVLFVNPRSGGGKAARAEVAGRARQLGIEAVVLAPGQGIQRPDSSSVRLSELALDG